MKNKILYKTECNFINETERIPMTNVAYWKWYRSIKIVELKLFMRIRSGNCQTDTTQIHKYK